MRYKLLRGFVDSLTVDVNRLLERGWVPLGPPFSLGGLVAQALILPDDPDPEEQDAG